MLQTGLSPDALEKVVMHNRYVVKVHVLEIKPQVDIDNSSVFICGYFFAEKGFLPEVQCAVQKNQQFKLLPLITSQAIYQKSLFNGVFLTINKIPHTQYPMPNGLGRLSFSTALAGWRFPAAFNKLASSSRPAPRSYKI